LGYAKRRKRKEVKVCSKSWFGHTQVQEKRKEEK
jgi:hypothetical protein